MDSLTNWRHKGGCLCYWITVVIWWIHIQSEDARRGQHIWISELLSLFNGFTYYLKTQKQHIWISDLLLSFDGFTYFLKTQGQHICISTIVIWWIHIQPEDTRQGQFICISELSLLFDGFTYKLKTQGQHICFSELPLLFDRFPDNTHTSCRQPTNQY